MINDLIVVLPIPLLLLAALLCWLLGRRIPTRRLGVGAALATLCALAALVIGTRLVGLPIELGNRPWISAFGVAPSPVAQATFALRIDGLSTLFAGAALTGGMLSLLFLAQSLGGSLIGYGRLWSALLIMLSGTVLGLLANDFLVLLFGWGLAIVGTALARQIVGSDDKRPPAALGMAAFAGFALLIAVFGFVLRPGDLTSGSYAFSDIDATIAFGTWLPLLLAVMIALGMPPFGRMLSDDEGTPPALHGCVIACGVPLLAMHTFLRVLGLTLGGWPNGWFAALTAIGALGAFAGGANALRSQRFGPLVGWQAVAQWGMVFVALGQYDSTRPLGDAANAIVVLATVALALCTIWTTIAAAAALGALERRTGSDHIGGQVGLRRPLRAAGLAYALAASTALGLPALPGFWPRRWLLDQPAASPILLIVFVAGGGLLALSYIGPLATFWRVDRPTAGSGINEIAASAAANTLVLAASTVPMLIYGVAPTWMVRGVLLPALPAIQPVAVDPANPLAGVAALLEATSATPATQIALGALAVLIVAGAASPGLARAAAGRSLRFPGTPPWTGGEALDRDEGTAHPPLASGDSLRAIATLANPRPLLGGLGRGIEWLSDRVAWAAQIFSGRYYLTGILIAALTLILLLLQ